MKSRSSVKFALLIVSLGLFAAGLYALGRNTLEVPASALDVAPKSALAVAHVDVRRLLASDAYRAFVGESDREFERVRRECGLDPLAHIDSAVVFVNDDEEPSRDHLGVLLRGRLRDDALLRCMKTVIEASGGGIRETTLFGLPAIASLRSDSRAVFLSDNAVLGGIGPVIEASVATMRRKQQSSSHSPILAALWTAIEHDADLAVVARVPGHWRGALQRVARRASIDAIATLEGAGASLALGAQNRLRFVLRADNAADASSIVQGLNAFLDAQRSNPVVTLTPIGTLLRRLHLETRDQNVIANIEASTSEVQAVGEAVQNATGGRPSAGEPIAPTPPAAGAPAQAP